MTARFL